MDDQTYTAVVDRIKEKEFRYDQVEKDSSSGKELKQLPKSKSFFSFKESFHYPYFSLWLIFGTIQTTKIFASYPKRLSYLRGPNQRPIHV